MRNILLIIVLVFSFGISQSYAQKRKSVSEVEKIVILELNKKEDAKSKRTSKGKVVKRKEVKKANKLMVKKGTNAKIITVKPPVRPPRPPSPPCICYPISIIQNGLDLGQLLNIYPNATIVVSGQNKQRKEFKLNSSNSTISQKEFESLKGDVNVSIQLMNKRNRENPAPIEMTLQR